MTAARLVSKRYDQTEMGVYLKGFYTFPHKSSITFRRSVSGLCNEISKLKLLGSQNIVLPSI
jgi:hypothetical protein